MSKQLNEQLYVLNMKNLHKTYLNWNEHFWKFRYKLDVEIWCKQRSDFARRGGLEAEGAARGTPSLGGAGG